MACIRENLGEEFKPEEIEIIHRVGTGRLTDRDDHRSTQSPKPRVVAIAKLVSNKTKNRLLVKRRQLKGKKAGYHGSYGPRSG